MIRALASGLLLLFAHAACAQPSLSEQQVLLQLDTLGDSFRDQGYTSTVDRRTGALDSETVVTFEVSLEAGTEYLVLGVCDADCVDLDLSAYDGAGDEVAVDVEEDEFPELWFSTGGSETYTIQVDMVACASEPCGWGVVVLAAEPGSGAPLRAGAPVGESWVERGTLERGDEILDSGELADELSLQGEAGQYLLLDLSSREFDPYLILIAPSGEQFENDDWEGSAERSLLSLDLTESGEYQVLITTYEPGEGGAYELAITSRAGRPAGDQSAWSERGALTADDLTLVSGEYLDVYELEGVPGQRLSVDMASDEFDTYLILVAPNGEQLENDDAEDLPGHSVLTTELKEAGTYRVLATSYQPATGAYQLSFQLGGSRSAAERRQQDVVRVGVGDRRTGALEEGDAVLDGGELADRYVFDGRAGQGVVIEMRSTDFDTYLGLLFPDGDVVENDDHLQQPGTSRIELALPQDGRYGVLATSYQAGEAGRYELDLQSPAQPPPGPGRSRAPEDRRVFALSIGISDYPGDEGDLAYTAEDAVRIQQALQRGAGMRPEDSVLLTDAQATRANVVAALSRLGSQMRDSDLFVLFFSGHGNRVPRADAQPSDPDSLDETLSLYDGELLDDEMAALLDGLPAGQTLLVLDSCFSGGFAKDVISAPNRMGLFSSEEDVTSQVAAKFRAGGYLAVFLADAVGEGYADDGDGELTALEVSQYVYERYRSDVKSQRSVDDYVRTGGPQLGYQHLVVDRGSISPYQTLFRLLR